MASTAPSSVTVQTYGGTKLGIITVEGNDLRGSDESMQEIADSFTRRAGSAQQALRELDGWQNGYLFASSDPDAAAVESS